MEFPSCMEHFSHLALCIFLSGVVERSVGMAFWSRVVLAFGATNIGHIALINSYCGYLRSL